MAPLLLIMLSFVGGCAGSAAGGIKVARVQMVVRQGLREIRQLVHPKGQFVVNFADANRAVLRPTTGRSDGPARNLRVIVDYPAGAPLPDPGSTLSRDDTRPYEITEVRRQSDGQLNVFVREIIKP